MIISKITKSDLPRICEIERLSFTHPWSEESVSASFENQSDVFFAAKENGVIKGFLLLSDYGEDGYLVNIAVDPACRRRGVARELMNYLIDYVCHRFNFLSLEVRASNTPAIALYGDFGFEPAGLRKSYYSDPVEDAVIMTRFFNENK